MVVIVKQGTSEIRRRMRDGVNGKISTASSLPFIPKGSTVDGSFMANQIKIATLGSFVGRRSSGTLNTFDDLPVMIVFTFSSTTDSAESLLAMSSKSTYYPKPISGSRLFVEPALVILCHRSFFSSSLSKCHTKDL